MQHSNTAKADIVIKTLADILREERELQNKSQRRLADEFDIQKSMISRLENAKNGPKLVSILTVCEALDILPSMLFEKLQERLPKGFSLIDK